MILLIIEYVILQSILIWWFINTIKNYPKKDSAYSYRVLVGNIGVIIILTVLLINSVLNERSLLKDLLSSF